MQTGMMIIRWKRVEPTFGQNPHLLSSALGFSEAGMKSVEEVE